jgi:phage terminase large subunit
MWLKGDGVRNGHTRRTPEIVKVKVTPIFRKNQKAKASTVINVGGAGSSKTYSLCQFFIFKRLLKYANYKLLILRKARVSNKLSVQSTFINMLKDYGIYREGDHNITDLIYYFADTNSYVRFAGLDDREKIKSTEWHDIWVEEANEISLEDFTFLKTRKYRGNLSNGFTPRIYLSLNPVECWVHNLESKDNTETIHSTYKDNPYVNQEYIDTLENLKNEDITYYNIYTKGIWSLPQNLVYRPFIIDKVFPESVDNTIYGLDFGYNNPTAVIKIQEKDKELYLTELLYKTKLTNADLIEELKILIPNGERAREIYADSAEPDRINEIYNAGFNILPSDKGKNSVKDGIDFCKRMKIHTLENNLNLNAEVRYYKWREDKNGNVIDEPVKYKDHLLDAMRYAVYTHYKNLIGEPRIRFI